MASCLLLSLCLAPLLAIPTDGSPVRFGVRVAAGALEQGLSLAGEGVMQWRRLPIGDAAVQPERYVWIEVAIVAPRGVARVMRGGAGPCVGGRGPAYVRTQEDRPAPGGRVCVERWRWLDGTVDERKRTTFTERMEVGGEVYEVGEALTIETRSLAQRASYWCRDGRQQAVACGLLPVRGRARGANAALRRHLRLVTHRLVEMPGRRGAGDFLRSDGEVTNLEFDTALALLRCAVANSDARAWSLALRAVGHLRDRDIDVRTGLPFVHGKSHRAAPPEIGHVWLQGMLWVALLTADDQALMLVQSIGRALAVSSPRGVGRNERLREYAWPLLELEHLHAVAPQPRVAEAADRLAVAIEARFDPVARTFRFGEGELGGGVYFERGWLTAGLLLPALEAHLRRADRGSLAAKYRIAQRAITEVVGSGARGLPTHWRIRDGRKEALHYERGTARAGWLLEGLELRSQTRLLQRSSSRRAFAETPPLDHPDLPTEFTLLARCRWVWR